jgi:hypothetical protein
VSVIDRPFMLPHRQGRYIDADRAAAGVVRWPAICGGPDAEADLRGGQQHDCGDREADLHSTATKVAVLASTAPTTATAPGSALTRRASAKLSRVWRQAANSGANQGLGVRGLGLRTCAAPSRVKGGAQLAAIGASVAISAAVVGKSSAPNSVIPLSYRGGRGG